MFSPYYYVLLDKSWLAKLHLHLDYIGKWREEARYLLPIASPKLDSTSTIQDAIHLAKTLDMDIALSWENLHFYIIPTQPIIVSFQ